VARRNRTLRARARVAACRAALEALDAIWANSVRSSAARLRIPHYWRAAAAAVFVTALGATTLYFISNPRPHRRADGR
jgi:hypothetical protein